MRYKFGDDSDDARAEVTAGIRARRGKKCRKCGGYSCPETNGEFCRWMQRRDRSFDPHTRRKFNR